MHTPVTLRAVRTDDEAFQYRVYAGTRAEELAPLGWDEDQKERFLRMQFAAQSRFYKEQFPDADYRIILSGSRAIGRLYVDRREDEIRIIDIALLPEDRNRGVGTALMGDVLAEARRLRKPVRIHVERNNVARRLYQRMGFVRVGENGVYDLMEWAIDGPSAG